MTRMGEKRKIRLAHVYIETNGKAAQWDAKKCSVETASYCFFCFVVAGLSKTRAVKALPSSGKGGGEQQIICIYKNSVFASMV